MRGDAAGGTRGDGVVSAEDQGQVAFFEGFLHGVAQGFAGIGDFVDILAAFFADGHFFGLFHDDVADVLDVVAEMLDAGLQTGNAQGGGAHIHAAAAGAEVHGNADDADLLRHGLLRDSWLVTLDSWLVPRDSCPVPSQAGKISQRAVRERTGRIPVLRRARYRQTGVAQQLPGIKDIPGKSSGGRG